MFLDQPIVLGIYWLSETPLWYFWIQWNDYQNGYMNDIEVMADMQHHTTSGQFQGTLKLSCVIGTDLGGCVFALADNYFWNASATEINFLF
jgi:hypothetical protein